MAPQLGAAEAASALGASDLLGSACLLKVYDDLSSLVKLLESAFALPTLPIPSHLSFPDLKEFCSGLLEGKAHPWNEVLESHPRTVRWSVGASLFLFRKRLPVPPDPENVSKFLRRVSSPAPATDPDFLRFSEMMIRKLFKRGWDRGYGGYCSRASLSTSACLSNSRKKGGSRGCPLSYHTYQSMVSGDKPIPFDPTVRVSSVRDGGKDRIVTIGGVERGVLKPLHSMLYDHLSQKHWLLRGDATPRRFKDFTLKKGEVFVSGDYESATDNLSLEYYEAILDMVLDTTSVVPDEVKEFARRSARSEIVEEIGGPSTRQRRGQLMGNLLSFPFLCLTNYLAFRYLVPRRVPVLINGDDIVFRATRTEAECWFAGIQRTGLVLSRGKTLVDHQFFSLNSTFFRARTIHRPHQVPMIRSKALFNKPESVSAWVGQFRECAVGGSGGFRDAVRRLFVRLHPKWLWTSRRSITRGLGVRVSIGFLKSCALWDREKFYLSLPFEEQLPPSPSVITWDCMPSGWEKKPISLVGKEVRRRWRIDERRFLEVMNVKSWLRCNTIRQPSDAWKLYLDRLAENAYRYSPLHTRRNCRLLGDIVGNHTQGHGVSLLTPKQLRLQFLGRDDQKYHDIMSKPCREYVWVDTLRESERRGEDGGVRL